MNRNKEKKEIDPEELMRRKFRAKCLFRALGRLAMANTYWLIEAVDEYQGEDVKKRVEQAMRGKARRKQLLTVADKALLNKPLAERTDQEKKYIYRIIGGLKCFKRYPNHVKKKLAAVTGFQYYGPNRVVVRQHQEAMALYFIISGDVTVSQLVYDELLEEQISVDIGHMHSGDMFGEVSLLHNIPRTATVTTDDHCEFLQIMAEDFKNVLQASIQAQWDEVLQAMTAFTYFDALDEQSRREGCIVAKLKSYAINETILGDGQGVANYVYFTLSGQCQMIESMKIYVTIRPGKEFYTLHDPWVPEEESEEDLEKKYLYLYQDFGSQQDATSAVSQGKMSVSLPQPELSGKRAFSKSLGSILKLPSIHGADPRLSVAKSKSMIHAPRLSQPEVSQNRISTHCNKPSEGKITETDEDETADLNKEEDLIESLNRIHSKSKRISIDEVKSGAWKNSQDSGNSKIATVIEESHLLLPSSLDAHDKDKRYSVRYSIRPDPRELRTYFMQVCKFNPGSTFGLGENMRDRRIVALTPVSCMLLPKVWLLQRNTANIWTRILHFLEKKIPKKDQLFKKWEEQRRWLKYRDMLVEDVVARTQAINYTSVHDVPYSLRMDEMLDI